MLKTRKAFARSTEHEYVEGRTDGETDGQRTHVALHNGVRGEEMRPLFINSQHDIVLSVYQLLAVVVVDALMFQVLCRPL